MHVLPGSVVDLVRQGPWVDRVNVAAVVCMHACAPCVSEGQSSDRWRRGRDGGMEKRERRERERESDIVRKETTEETGAQKGEYVCMRAGRAKRVRRAKREREKKGERERKISFLPPCFLLSSLLYRLHIHSAIACQSWISSKCCGCRRLSPKKERPRERANERGRGADT